MQQLEPPVEAIDEVRQLNSLFLGFLRDRPQVATDRFGLSESVAAALQSASAEQINHAASFPRALFRLMLPDSLARSIREPAKPLAEPGERVLKLTLLHSARSLSRMSGYLARLLLRLANDDVVRLRYSEVDEIVSMSEFDDLLQLAFDELDWLWQELLTQTKPEYRRRLLLIGLQPDFSIQAQGAFV